MLLLRLFLLSGLLFIFTPRFGSRVLLGLWCAGPLPMGGPGSIIRSGFGKVLSNGFFAFLGCLFWCLSLFCFWSICVAPVRGGPYFSLSPKGTSFGASLPKKSRQKKGAENAALLGVWLTGMAPHEVSTSLRNRHSSDTRPAFAQHRPRQ